MTKIPFGAERERSYLSSNLDAAEGESVVAAEVSVDGQGLGSCAST